MNKNLARALLLGALLILVAPVTLIDTESKNFSEINIPEQQNYWHEQITSLGGEKAYQSFKQIYLKEYPDRIHQVTHIFGDALYKVEAESGISVCDNDFAFGCYHGFMIAALKNKGLTIVPILNNECIQKNGNSETGCRHGIGHGLLEFLGRNKLQQALEICSTLQTVTPLGCTQGVFMEFNFPGMMGSGKQFLGIRKLESDLKIYEPCNNLPSQFSVACYYEQSQWWTRVIKNYQKVGSLCTTLGEEKVKKACFLGVGVSASENSNFNIEKTITACEQMPSNSARIECKSGAAWVFKADPRFEQQFRKLCRNLSIEDYKKCINNAIPPKLIVS